MAARAVAALSPNTAGVVAVAGDPAVATLGVEVRPDVVAGRGPLGGLHAALLWARERSLDGVFVLACDLPLVGAPLVRALVSAWGQEDAVVPVGPAGPEPLCALYAARVLPAVEALLDEPGASPRALLARVALRVFPIERAREVSRVENPFLNVNTMGMHAAAEAALRGAE
jgi:molybdopterin-guanine dinucleotide biosynthesis protein A